MPLGFVSGAVFELFVGINLSALDPPGFGNRRSLSSATVAAEQVAVELTAPRMESALAVKLDILEQRKRRRAIKIQTLSNNEPQN